MNVSLTSKDALEAVSGKYRVSQKMVIERLLEWFKDQPEEVQAPILMQIPQAYKSDFVRIILDRMVESEGREDAREVIKSIEQKALGKKKR
ncbi:hypothetical protein KS4_23910 [Poriferisphaera corsica]|uniref:Uncharacterized protein n=1 Tax=Poriferisphaera corsica TaxID=2528020 RepID=A0A517YVU5_9BACT|nr:hypothetical protein KS4_23910 [Poriferisphaera corsica]